MGRSNTEVKSSECTNKGRKCKLTDEQDSGCKCGSGQPSSLWDAKQNKSKIVAKKGKGGKIKTNSGDTKLQKGAVDSICLNTNINHAWTSILTRANERDQLELNKQGLFCREAFYSGRRN